MTDNLDHLIERLDALELAVLNLARLEFGDTPGHPFRGNQYGEGSGGDKPTAKDIIETKPAGGKIGDATHIKAVGEKFRDPKLAAVVRKDKDVVDALDNPPSGWAAHPQGNNSIVKMIDTPRGNNASAEIFVNSSGGKLSFMPTVSINGRDVTPKDSPVSMSSADEAARYLESAVAGMKRR